MQIMLILSGKTEMIIKNKQYDYRGKEALQKFYWHVWKSLHKSLI